MHKTAFSTPVGAENPLQLLGLVQISSCKKNNDPDMPELQEPLTLMQRGKRRSRHTQAQKQQHEAQQRANLCEHNHPQLLRSPVNYRGPTIVGLRDSNTAIGLSTSGIVSKPHMLPLSGAGRLTKIWTLPALDLLPTASSGTALDLVPSLWEGGDPPPGIGGTCTRPELPHEALKPQFLLIQDRDAHKINHCRRRGDKFMLYIISYLTEYCIPCTKRGIARLSCIYLDVLNSRQIV